MLQISDAEIDQGRPSPATATASRCRPASGWSSAPASSASGRTMRSRRTRARRRSSASPTSRRSSREAGLGLTDIVRINAYVTDRAHHAALHGRARPACRRSAAGLDADDRLGFHPAGVQGRGRGDRRGAGMRSRHRDGSDRQTPRLVGRLPRRTEYAAIDPERRSPCCRSRRSSSTGRICRSATDTLDHRRACWRR